MDLLSEAGIKLTAVKRSLLVPSRNFPVELLFLRDDDIPDSVATGTADLGIVGYNEVLEKQRDVTVIKRLGFSRCRISLAVPNTLVSNNLREVEKVIDSEAVLIGGKALDAEKQEVLDELLFRFEAVKAASGKKYILMNVPRTQLDTVLQILPGIKSPTVLPLADKDWCSVHTVLEEKFFWEIINRLKAAGAEGILVLNIEKMVL